MKVVVGISNRHVHLNQKDLEVLFGKPLEKDYDLKQPNNFASKQFVDIQTPKSTIKNVRVIGGVRSYTQVEISKTDSYKLGLNPPIKTSGNLEGGAVITIIGPSGSVTVPACIIANRHIHISEEEKIKYNLPNKVKVKVVGEKGGILDNIYLKTSEQSSFELHLDTDDGNAFLLKTGDEVEIIKADF